MENLITNKYLYVPILLWFFIQLFKLIYDLMKNKKINLKKIMESGGMPSSHTAVVTSLATLIGKYEGINSSMFAVAVIFSFIVMYDACGVRRSAGKQAIMLNKIIEAKEISSLDISEKLKEVLGHSPKEVLIGAIIGIIVGIVV